MASPSSRATALLLLIAFCCTAATAQSGRRPDRTPSGSGTTRSDDGEDQIELRAQEVLLSITVRDSEGRPATGLTRDDFIVAEDQKRQKIESFSYARVPVNVVLLLDASGSVFSEFASIRRAAASFVDRLGPEDRVSVIQFADKVELLQDWTADREAIRHSLNWRYRGGEATAFWDGVYLAAADQLTKVEGRRAIIILSDGVDSSSKITEVQAQAAVDRVGASVYVVSKAQALIEQARPYAGKAGVIGGTAGQARYAIDLLTAAQDRMRAMADRSGGRLYAPLNDADLASVYGQVADELKQQYVLSYVSSNDARDGTWRAIQIFLDRPGLAASTRKGYVAE